MVPKFCPVSTLEVEIVTVPWGCAPTESTWEARTIILFDDACLTPNTVWEEVNTSFVVLHLKKMIRRDQYRMQQDLSPGFGILRDTRDHRQLVQGNGYQLRYIKHTYRFTVAEVIKRRKGIPEDEMPDVNHIPASKKAVQVKILSLFGITSEHEVPGGYDMFVASLQNSFTGFLMIKMETKQIGPLKASDMNSFWFLFFALVKLRLCDDQQCLTACLSLLDREMRENIVLENGSFLFSITLATRSSDDTDLPSTSQ